MTSSRFQACRVLVVAPQPTYADRGTPIAVGHVLRALSELGCRVDVLTYPLGVDLPLPGVRWSRVGNPFRYRHVPVGFSLRKVTLDVLLAVKLASMVRRSRYDYIHAVEEAAFLAALIGGAAGIPFLYDMPSSIPQQLSRHRLFGRRAVQALLRRCERWVLDRASLVVCSAGLEAHVREVAPETRVCEWSYPVAEPPASPAEARTLRRQLRVPDDARTVVYSGTFEPYQGLPQLVAAAARIVVETPDTVFILVGGHPKDVAEMKRLVSGKDLERSFRILPRVPREEAFSYVALADVVVSPRAYGDNLPLKVIDYLAAGKPIVATRIPAHTAILDATRAVLTEPDGDSLARGILAILEDETRAARLAREARAYGVRHLSWTAFRGSVRRHMAQLGVGGPDLELVSRSVPASPNSRRAIEPRLGLPSEGSRATASIDALHAAQATAWRRRHDHKA